MKSDAPVIEYLNLLIQNLLIHYPRSTWETFLEEFVVEADASELLENLKKMFPHYLYW